MRIVLDVRVALGTVSIAIHVVAVDGQRVARRVALRTVSLRTGERRVCLVELDPVCRAVVDAPAHRRAPRLAQHPRPRPRLVPRPQVHPPRRNQAFKARPQTPGYHWLHLCQFHCNLDRARTTLRLQNTRDLIL